MSRKLLLLPLALILSIVLPQRAAAQIPEFGAGIATRVALDQVVSGAMDLLDHASQQGDYLIGKGAIEILGALDAWKTTNQALLDRTFDGIDESQRNTLANARASINEALSGFADQLETARQITESVSQITANIPTAGGHSYVLRQQPRVIHPTVRDTLLVRLRGVNLDRANPQLMLSDGPARRSLLGPLEVQFYVPMSQISADPDRMQLHSLQLKHRTRAGRRFLFWPRYRDVERQVVVATLPSTVATYELSGTRRFERRETATYVSDAGRFEARNREVIKIANPRNGWRWDLDAPLTVVSTGRGEAGRCEELLMNGSNEHGIRVRAYLDAIQHWEFPRRLRWKAGYAHCGVRGTIYRMVEDTAPVEPVQGSLGWTGDVAIPLPPDTESFALRVNTFNGEERVVTNAHTDKMFTVMREPSRLILRPVVPQDILVQ
jgi:hypothetical protein